MTPAGRRLFIRAGTVAESQAVHVLILACLALVAVPLSNVAEGTLAGSTSSMTQDFAHSTALSKTPLSPVGQCRIFSQVRDSCSPIGTNETRDSQFSSVISFPSQWSVLPSQAQPPEIQGALLAYDPHWDAVILVGGSTCLPQYVVNGQCGNPVLANQTWAYHEGNWVNLTAQVGSYPVGAGEGGALLGFDTHDGYLVLFFRPLVTVSYTWTPPVTWVLGSRWSNLSLSPNQEPGTGFFAGYSGWIANDPQDGYLVLFGNGNQTWTFSGGLWKQLTNITSPPSPTTESASMTWDPKDKCVVLFGGQQPNYQGVPQNATWEFAHGNWTNVTNRSDSPPANWGGYLFYDPGSQQVILFEAGPLDPFQRNITWGFAGGIWTNLSSDIGSVQPNWSGMNGENFWNTGTSDVGDGYFLFLEVSFSGGIPQWGVPQPWAFGAPPIPFLTLSSNFVESNTTLTVNTTVLGGTSPFAFNFTGLPPGCSSPARANFSCAPSAPPSSPTAYRIALNVSDAHGFSGRTYADLQVVQGLTATAALSATTLDLGMSFTIDINALPGVLPISYRYSGLPPPCASSNQPDLVCVPTATGTFPVMATAFDALGVNRSFNWTMHIFSDPVLMILPVTTEVTEVGSTFFLAWNASGGDPPLRLTVSGLPAGCAPVSTPPLTCSPTANGTYAVNLTLKDGIAVTVNRTVTVQVAPRLTLLSMGIAPSSLVTLGNAFLLGANVSGGVEPFHYAYWNLPPGCRSVNASVLDCMPTSVGSWKVGVSVTDVVGMNVNGTIEVSVRAPTPLAFTSLDLGLVGILTAGGMTGVFLWWRHRKLRPTGSETPPIDSA